MSDQLLMLTVKLWQLIVDENGQDLMEYGLIVVLASLVAISLQQELAASVASLFSSVGTTLGATVK